MGKYIDYKTFNPIYAPGLSTYAVRGEKGENGENGTSLYYNKTSIKRNETERSFINEKIKNNELLTSSTSESENLTKYKEYDLVIDADGDIYYIVKDTSNNLELGKSVIGNISSSIKKNYIPEITTASSFKLNSTIGDASTNFRYNVLYSYEASPAEKTYETLYGCYADAEYDTGSASPISIEQVEIIDLLSGRIATIVE